MLDNKSAPIIHWIASRERITSGGGCVKSPTKSQWQYFATSLCRCQNAPGQTILFSLMRHWIPTEANMGGVLCVLRRYTVCHIYPYTCTKQFAIRNVLLTVQKRQNNLPRARFASFLLLFFLTASSHFCHRTFVCVYIHNPPIIYLTNLFSSFCFCFCFCIFRWMFLSHGLHQYDIMTSELNSTRISVIRRRAFFSRSIHLTEMILLHNVKTFTTNLQILLSNEIHTSTLIRWICLGKRPGHHSIFDRFINI